MSEEHGYTMTREEEKLLEKAAELKAKEYDTFWSIDCNETAYADGYEAGYLAALDHFWRAYNVVEEVVV